MKHIKLVRISYPVLFLCLIVSLIFLKTYRWDGNSGNNKEYVISGDGLGYYAYLPAIFIDKNLNDLTHNPRYTNEVNNRTVIKYYSGTSLLILPFFTVAHTAASVFSYDQDGYSPPYQFMVAIASIFYLFLGLFCLVRLLALFKISDLHSAMAIVLILFGTNLLYYSVFVVSMSHVYSFSMISCFVLVIKKLLTSHQLKYLYFSAFLLGIIILIRPTNGIVLLLISALSSTQEEFRELVLVLIKRWYHLIFSFLIFFLLVCIQLLAWHEQTGDFLIWSYSDEGFYFLKPQFLNVLFSFRKGLFIYTPLVFISLFGLTVIFKKSKFQFYSILFFLFVATYAISSWWNWYYGDSFGQRAFIDFYSIICLLLGILIENSFKRFRRRILLAILLACLSLNMIQSYQFYHKILHYYSMNAEKYRYVFLKTSANYRNVLGGNMDMEPYSKEPKKLIFSTLNDFEKEYPRWNNNQIVIQDDSLFDTGRKWTKYSIYTGNKFGAALVIQNDSLFYNSKKIFVEASLKRLEPEKNSSSKVLFVIDIRNNKNESLFYHPFKLNDTPNQDKCVWRTYNYSFEIPELKSSDDKISIYLWNKEHQNFLIDDFELNFYRIY